MIEKVKKIINETVKVSSFDARDAKLHNVDEAASQICQRFPKTEDNPNGYEPKPDESRLLTDKKLLSLISNKIYAEFLAPDLDHPITLLNVASNQERADKIAKWIVAKTASIVDKQARLEGYAEGCKRTTKAFSDAVKQARQDERKKAMLYIVARLKEVDDLSLDKPDFVRRMCNLIVEFEQELKGVK